MCIGESRIRDVWRRQNWNEMQMLCRSCDLNALLITRLGWQPWRPLGRTWRKCGTSACPTENRVGARPEPASASKLKYAVSWRQARGKSSQTKPSQAELRQVEATRSQAEASRVSQSESLLTTNAAAHKESNAKKKERAKGKPETHNSTHTRIHRHRLAHTQQQMPCILCHWPNFQTRFLLHRENRTKKQQRHWLWLWLWMWQPQRIWNVNWLRAASGDGGGMRDTKILCPDGPGRMLFHRSARYSETESNTHTHTQIEMKPQSETESELESRVWSM